VCLHPASCSCSCSEATSKNTIAQTTTAPIAASREQRAEWVSLKRRSPPTQGDAPSKIASMTTSGLLRATPPRAMACKILNPCQRAFTSPPECQLLHQLFKRRRWRQPRQHLPTTPRRQLQQQLPTTPRRTVPSLATALQSRQRCTPPQPQDQGRRRRYWPLQQPLPTSQGLLVHQLRHTVPQPLRRQATITAKAKINRYRLLSHSHLRRLIHPTTLRRTFRTVLTIPVKALIGNARCALFLTSGRSPSARGVDLPYPLDWR